MIKTLDSPEDWDATEDCVFFTGAEAIRNPELKAVWMVKETHHHSHQHQKLIVWKCDCSKKNWHTYGKNSFYLICDYLKKPFNSLQNEQNWALRIFDNKVNYLIKIIYSML